MCCYCDIHDDSEKEALLSSASDIYCGDCWGRVHLAFLIVFFAISAISAGLLLTSSISTDSNLNILCLGNAFRTVTAQGYAYASLLFGIILMLACFKCRPGEMAKLQGGMIGGACGLLFLFGVIGIAVFVFAIVVGTETNLLVIKSPNNTFYSCEFKLGQKNLYPLQSSPFLANSNGLGLTCEFWSVDKLCVYDVRSFKTTYPFINVNGTSGAYRCQSSDPNDSNLLSDYFGRFGSCLIGEFFCIPVSVVLFILSLCWLWRLPEWRDLLCSPCRLLGSLC